MTRLADIKWVPFITVSAIAVIMTAIPAACSSGHSTENVLEYVDPFIGTAHSRWFFFTPAAVPFGMAKLAPTTDGHLGNKSGWEAVGYDSRHNTIEGFANFHEFQIGGIVIAPTTGDVQTVPGDIDTPESGYRSRFDKKDEEASPGYYSVVLKDYGIKAELTATKRTGFHRYTFPAIENSNIIFNIGTRMGESGPVKDAWARYTPDGRIEGWVKTVPEYVRIYQEGADVTMYFSAQIDACPSSFGCFRGEELFLRTDEISGAGTGMFFTFDTREDRTINIKIGLSYTSVENARYNLDTEAAEMDFDMALDAAKKDWENALGRIRVEGGKKEDRVKFYTGLFHALLGRGLASDANGAYPKNDGTTGQILLDNAGNPVHNHYNTDAVWGAYWNLTQLWALAWPEYYSDWISSQILVYKDAGWLGDGIACSRYVSGVGSNMVGLAIAAAYNCGIRDFDIGTAYQAAFKNETGSKGRVKGAGKEDIGDFLRYGYCPYSDNPDAEYDFSASHTLEYSFSCYAVAQMARALEHNEDYILLESLSHGWENLFDTQTRLIRPRHRDGKFLEEFNPTAPWKGFQEGNAVQYTYYVPHHIERLVSLVGRDEFVRRLDSTFTISRENIFGGGTTVNAFSGLHSYYNHGNQPNLHISSLFNFAGSPWLSQKWMRLICNEFYGTDPVHGYGYGQDEDQGQLGAWYVMASMGLFDAKGLTAPEPSFQLGSPLFDKITITLNPDYYTGEKFIIKTTGNSTDSYYIQSAILNGKPVDPVCIPFAEITDGGRLEVTLSNKIPDRAINQATIQ